MANSTTQFGGFLTNVGVAQQANSTALGVPWSITHMLIGDAGGEPGIAPEPTPDPKQTALVRQVYRGQLNGLYPSPSDSSVLVAELVLPPETGGWWIRELALQDAAGNFIAVAKPAPSYKPLLVQGSGRTQTIRMHVVFGNTANVTLKVDPSVVLATRDYVDKVASAGRLYADEAIVAALNEQDFKRSVRVATTASITLSGLQKVDGIALAAGDRVLVKNQPAQKENGLYVASVGAWSRATDADADAEVSSGLIVAVEQGMTSADTLWQLVTDGAIVLGSTALVFQNITQGFASIDSPNFLGAPKVPTPAQFDKSKLAANSEFVWRAAGNLRDWVAYSQSVVLTAEDMGKFVYATANGMEVTLPTPASLPLGVRVVIQAASGAALITVKASAGFSGPNGPESASTSMRLASGVASEFVNTGVSWSAYGGSGACRLSMAGYIKHPGGLIEQWAVGVSDASGVLSVSLPIQFPQEIIGGMANEFSSSGWAQNGVSVWGLDFYGSTLSVARARVRGVSAGSGAPHEGVTGCIRVWGR